MSPPLTIVRAIVLGVWLLGSLGVEAVQAQDQAAERPADAAAEWVRKLGDSSFEVRTRATRELCKLGAQAIPALREAAKLPEAEVAFRAQHLLETLSNLYFSGARVSLNMSAATTAWNEPIDLLLTVENTSANPVKVPFGRPLSMPPSPTAVQQVAAMLDVADFLVVTGPDGQAIALHVDDIRQDAVVNDMVDRKIAEVEESTLAPGESLQWRVAEFNRGWARYPTYDEGEYHVEFNYVPQWDDDVLLQQSAGRVESQPVAFAVNKGSPEVVLGPVGPCELAASISNGRLRLELINHTDNTIWVNLNFGAERPPFAWLNLEFQGHGDSLPVELPPIAAAAQPYSIERVVSVGLGQRVEIASLAVEELRKRLNDIEEAWADGAAIQFEYVNLLDAAWQRQVRNPSGVDAKLMETVRASALPPRVLTGPIPSGRIATRTLQSP